MYMYVKKHISAKKLFRKLHVGVYVFQNRCCQEALMKENLVNFLNI